MLLIGLSRNTTAMFALAICRIEIVNGTGIFVFAMIWACPSVGTGEFYFVVLRGLLLRNC